MMPFAGQVKAAPKLKVRPCIFTRQCDQCVSLNFLTPNNLKAAFYTRGLVRQDEVESALTLQLPMEIESLPWLDWNV